LSVKRFNPVRGIVLGVLVTPSAFEQIFLTIIAHAFQSGGNSPASFASILFLPDKILCGSTFKG
jgi:hypothetical protein